MIELAPDQFHLARDLAAPSPLTVEARAVIGGSNPGWVLVDQLTDPRMALVWAQGMEGFYLLGETPPPGFARSLDASVNSDLAARLRSLGGSSLEISGGGPACDALIQEAFAHRPLRHDIQWVFRSAADHTAPSRPADPSVPLAEAVDLAGVDELLPVRSTIARFWGSVEKFKERGLGYCEVLDGVPASLCMSGFVDGGVHAVHVETAPAHRRKGLALRAASHTILDCLERGYMVHWDSMAINEASCTLAGRLGLERVAEYRSYFFEL